MTDGVFESVIDGVRAICMALPETTEQNEGSVGKPVFKVRDKIFAMQHPMDERPSLWCKATPGLREMLLGSEPERYFVPPYVGSRGWIGVWLDVGLEWGIIQELGEESYRKRGSKRLSARIGQKKKGNK